MQHHQKYHFTYHLKAHSIINDIVYSMSHCQLRHHDRYYSGFDLLYMHRKNNILVKFLN